MNFLITGVGGLIGSSLAGYIIENNLGTVIGIDDFSGGFEDNVPDKVKLYKINLVNDDIESIFAENELDHVFHLAAYAAEGLSPFIRCFNYGNNLIASAKLINSSINFGIKRFVFTSSMAVYGYGAEKPPFHEDMTPSPIDPYGVAKYAVELDLKIANQVHNLDYCIIRPHNVYGERQNIWDKYRNVLGIWMKRILDGQNPIIFGSGEQTRAFTYIEDILPCLYESALSPQASKQVFNLGGTNEISINNACKAVLKVTGSNLDPIHVESRHEVKDAFCNHQKSMELLGFEHKTSLEQGLVAMWNWARRQPERPSLQAWDKLEVEKSIYSYWR